MFSWSRAYHAWRLAAYFKQSSSRAESAKMAREAQLRISKASPFDLRIRRSSIHRLGVFAGRPIPKGVKVIEYTGERIARRETRRRFLKMLKTGRNYFARLVGSYWVLDGSVGGSGAELINHSCRPNLAPRRNRGRLWFVSLREIRRGEELVVDYRFPKKADSVRCHCGSPNCRGTINLVEPARTTVTNAD